MDEKVVKLGSLFRIGSSKRVLKSQWQTHGVPFYRGREVTRLSKDGHVENELFISQELYNEHAEKHGVPTKDDIIITAIGTIGNSYIVRSEDKFYFKDASVLWLKKQSDTDSEYINFWLKSPLMREQLDEGNGATVDTLTIRKLQELEINLPSVEEQKRIVAILDEAFADIEQVRAKTEQNLKNARELFESYLQQVFSQRGEGWVGSELFKHVKFIDYRGKTPKKTEDGLRLITAKNVRMGFLKHEPAEFVAPESYDEWMTRGIPQKGDVLFTTEAPLANVAQLDTDEKVVFAQRIITMQPDRSVINNDFLKYLLLSPPIQKKIHEKGTGATATGIKASLLKKIPIEYPRCINEQIEYVEMFNSLKESVNQLEVIYQNKLQALDELKKSILQKAFSGELTKTSDNKTKQGALA